MMIIFTILFLMIDIVSKIVVSKLMDLYDSIVIVKDFFYITYVRNTGAAWSIFEGEVLGLVIVSLIIILFIIYYISKQKIKTRLEKICYSLILGGSFGNLLDRIIYGYVVDFLDFNIFGYDYPIFNLADCFIFVGVLMLIIYTWRCNDGDQSYR